MSQVIVRPGFRIFRSTRAGRDETLSVVSPQAQGGARRGVPRSKASCPQARAPAGAQEHPVVPEPLAADTPQPPEQNKMRVCLRSSLSFRSAAPGVSVVPQRPRDRQACQGAGPSDWRLQPPVQK